MIQTLNQQGEEHKAGFTIHNPMRKHSRRDQFKQTNGASKIGGFPKGISKQGVSTRWHFQRTCWNKGQVSG